MYEVRLKTVTKVYNMIYKWKIRFTNVYNDLCVILGTHTKKFKHM